MFTSLSPTGLWAPQGQESFLIHLFIHRALFCSGQTFAGGWMDGWMDTVLKLKKKKKKKKPETKNNKKQTKNPYHPNFVFKGGSLCHTQTKIWTEGHFLGQFFSNITQIISLHIFLLALWRKTTLTNCPTCSKYFQTRFGVISRYGKWRNQFPLQCQDGQGCPANVTL